MRAGVLLAVLAAGCQVVGTAGSLSTSSSGGPNEGETTADASSSEGGAPKLDVAQADVAAMECASIEQSISIEERPSDIVIAVDRAMEAQSMDDMFLNFSQLIANDGLDDVRVQMVAGYPPDGVCIDAPPLGIEQCPQTDDNPPMYRHYDVPLDGAGLLTQLLDASPSWAPQLRADARTHVFVLAGRDATLSIEAFDGAVRALLPERGSYTFHAVAPGDAAGDCATVEGPWAVASSYAAHAAATGGVFENACDYSLGPLFDELLSTIEAVALDCEYPIPTPPEGFVFEPGFVNVDYDDGEGLQTVGFVEDAADCALWPDGWSYDDPVDPSSVVMCPQTCARFEQLAATSIELRFGCATIPAG